MNLQSIWWVFAIIASMAGASTALNSEYFKVKGSLLIFWRGAIPAIFLTPVIFFVEIPTSWVFYLATFATSIILSYSDALTFNASHKFGAGVATRIKPMSLWFGFVLWMLITPAFATEILNDIPVFIGIVLAISSCVIAVFMLKKCDISREAIIFLLPAIFLAAVVGVLNKIANNFQTTLKKHPIRKNNEPSKSKREKQQRTF